MSAFSEWFGDSQVVDASGRPLVVYHGGYNVLAGSGRFRPSPRSGYGAGIYFTPDEARAQEYARDSGGVVTAVYLRVLNPLMLEVASPRHPVVMGLVQLGMDPAVAERRVEREEEQHGYCGKILQSLAVAKGYDGIFVLLHGTLLEVVVFRPDQIKSATQNVGTYTLGDPDIRRNNSAPHTGGVPVEVGACSETGPVREHNEDNLYVAPAHGFAVVCDGMGGHHGGEIASKLAVEAVAKVLLATPEQTAVTRLTKAAYMAQAAVFQRGKRDPGLRGMGTTLVAALVEEEFVTVVSVGDSRAYLVRGPQWPKSKAAELLTMDETAAGVLYRDKVISWEQFVQHPQRNRLLRAIGSSTPWRVTPELDYEVQIRVAVVRPGDRVVLCTDGVSESLMPTDIAVLAQGPPREAAAKMVKVALARDGGDNATAVIMAVGDTPRRNGDTPRRNGRQEGISPFFPRALAEQVRHDYPKLWSRHGTGGNPPTRWTGDDAYRAWGWCEQLLRGQTPPARDRAAAEEAFVRLTGGSYRGSPADLFSTVVGLWLARREAYLARHGRDYRPGGIIAAIKWGVILPWAWPEGRVSEEQVDREIAADQMVAGLA